MFTVIPFFFHGSGRDDYKTSYTFLVLFGPLDQVSTTPLILNPFKTDYLN